MIIDLQTSKVIVYIPTTVAGSKYYGRNTQWCTASENDNMFNHYSNLSPLYIIQSVSTPIDKYQFHFRKIGIDNRKKGKKSEQKLKGIFYK